MLSVKIFPVKFLNEVHPSILCPVKNYAILYMISGLSF